MDIYKEDGYIRWSTRSPDLTLRDFFVELHKKYCLHCEQPIPPTSAGGHEKSNNQCLS